MAKHFKKDTSGYMPDAPQELLNKSIDELNLFPDTIAKLKAVELFTVCDLASCEMRHLYKINGIGKRDVFAVLRAVKSCGLDFKPSERIAKDPLAVEGANDIAPQHNNKDAQTIGNGKNNANNKNDRQNPNNHNKEKFVDNKNKESFAKGNGSNSENDKLSSDNQKRMGNEKIRQKNGVQQDDNAKQRNNQGRDNVPNNQKPNNGGVIERQKVNTRDYDVHGNKKRNSTNEEVKKPQDKKQSPSVIVLPPLKNEDGLYKFYKFGKWGYKDEGGKVIIEPQFDEAYNFSEGMAAVELKEKLGFINKKGEIVIPVHYDTVCSYSEGVASVTLDDKCAYIDKEGVEVYGFIFEAATPFNNNIALVKKDGKWGYMDRETGEIRLR